MINRLSKQLKVLPKISIDVSDDNDKEGGNNEKELPLPLVNLYQASSDNIKHDQDDLIADPIPNLKTPKPNPKLKRL